MNIVIDEFPKNSVLKRNRGNLCFLFGLHRQAIDDYTKAIELNNDDAEAYYNRALTHFLLYDKISGCSDLDKSLALGYESAAEAIQYFCMQY